MKHNNGGFSLIEIIVSMAILGLFATATCTGLVLALRMNDKTEQMLQAQLAVSSAVETLMAEGITGASNPNYDIIGENDRFPAVSVSTEAVDSYYNVTVSSENDLVSVTTQIRKAVD